MTLPMISIPTGEKLMHEVLMCYTDQNAALLIIGTEIEQKLMWGNTRDTRAESMRAVCTELGLFVRSLKITGNHTLRGPKTKVSIEIELITRYE
jgi:hypothetical protein